MRRESAERVSLAAAGVVITVLTVAAFWLSYAHLAGVARTNGLGVSEARTWAWPATLDLFIVAGELLMLRAGFRRERDWWAYGLTVAGSVGSIGLNVAGVGGHAAFLAYLVAAVPPTAALLAFGALMRQVHGLVATPVAIQVAAAPEPFAGLAAFEAETQVEAPATQVAALHAVPAEVAARAAVSALWTPERDDAATLLTVGDVARECGVATATVRSWVARGRLVPTVRQDGRPLFAAAAVAALTAKAAL